MNATLLGMVLVEAAYRCDPQSFGWRAEPYEFIADIPAIDLLTGSPEYRTTLEAGGSVRGVLDTWEDDRRLFLDRRGSCLLYP